MTAREQRRAQVLTRVIAGQYSQAEAAQVLGLSVRQVRRLAAAYTARGPAALVHGNRGRPPAHRLADTTREQIVALAQGRYAGVNQQHLTEKLTAEGIRVSRTSVRRILLAAGVPSPRPRRPARHRQRRERMAQEGMLLQADGSRHQWLGPDGPYLTLIGMIDDATGIVPWALFREQEDAAGYLAVLRRVVQTKGIPLALYVDRHGIFERSRRDPPTLEEELAGGRLPTQVGRVMGELGIAHVAARSPQAKGRIERFWGTCQDRLVTELRLASAQTLADANAVLWDWLPHFNARFAVPPALPGTAYRPVPDGFTPETVFCFKYTRVVAADNTVRFGDQRLQLLPGRDRVSYAKARVEVHERLDGSLGVYYHGAALLTQAAPAEAPRLRARPGTRSPGALATAAPATRAGTACIGAATPALPPPPPASSAPPRPAPDHPWRQSFRPRRTNSLAT